MPSLRPASAGLFWVAVLLSTILAVQRSYAIESADAARDGLRVSRASTPPGSSSARPVPSPPSCSCSRPGSPSGSRCSTGHTCPAPWSWSPACAAGTLGLAAVGTLYGVVASGLRTRETLLPLLFLPVVAPVLLAATKAWNEALAGTPGRAGSWLDVLAVFAVLYMAIGTVAFGPLLEDG